MHSKVVLIQIYTIKFSPRLTRVTEHHILPRILQARFFFSYQTSPSLPCLSSNQSKPLQLLNETNFHIAHIYIQLRNYSDSDKKC